MEMLLLKVDLRVLEWNWEGGLHCHGSGTWRLFRLPLPWDGGDTALRTISPVSSIPQATVAALLNRFALHLSQNQSSPTPDHAQQVCFRVINCSTTAELQPVPLPQPQEPGQLITRKRQLMLTIGSLQTRGLKVNCPFYMKIKGVKRVRDENPV